MFDAKVYHIMFASPSDITEEYAIFKRVLEKWNRFNSETRHCVFLPLNWSENSFPTTGKHPQKLLDDQLVEKSDAIVCVFGTKLGTPTDTHESGTAEELELHRENGKQVFIYFMQDISAGSLEPDEYSRLLKYKKSLKNGLYSNYNDSTDFESCFEKGFSLWANTLPVNIEEEQKKQLEKLSSKEIDILTEIAHSSTQEAAMVSTKDGVFWNIGDYFQDELNLNYTTKELKKILSALKKKGYLTTGRTMMGDIYYMLSDKGSDYADDLEQE